MEKTSIKKGLPPESLIYTGDKKQKTEIGLLDYNAKNYSEKTIKEIKECLPIKKISTVSWLNVVGLSSIEKIKKIGECFKIHPLVLEDILNVNQRPKIEDFGEYIFIVLKMIKFNKDKNKPEAEQISIIFSKNFIITFSESKGDAFNVIKQRLKNKEGLIRGRGTDYLVYVFIDIIIDFYFSILEKIGEEAEELEEQLLTNANLEKHHSIHHLKKDLFLLRKSAWPLREIINYLEKTESNLINKSSILYFRDIYDHTIQLIDTIETYREMATGLLDIYLSVANNKMNEVMKTLTIISTIFIPLTFITGLYGMNFKYMPELKEPLAYPIVLFVMVAIIVAMIFYFKKKKWL